MTRQFKSGYIPDPKDKKFIPFDKSQLSKVAYSNDDIDLREFSPELRHDQGDTGSCVGNSSIRSLEIKLGEKFGVDKITTLSVMDLYSSARNLMNPSQSHIDQGTNVCLAMDALRLYGVCRDKSWPWDPSKINITPSVMSVREEALNKITGHFRMVSTGNNLIDDIILNLRAKNPVVFGMNVGEEFMDYDSSSDPISKCTNIKGAHALCIVGYVSGKIIIENSWGNFYGNNGFCYIEPELLISSAANANDFWVMQTDFDLFWEK